VILALVVMPAAIAKPAAGAQSRRLLDFRPVFRNRAAMGWIAGYTVHTLELAALRAWGVTFLAMVVATKGAPSWLPDPTVLFTVAGFVGIVVSITGNETAQRWGRARVVTAAMSAAAALSVITGWTGNISALVATLFVIAWNAAIYFDSSALTAGTVQAAGKELRGARWDCTACAATLAAASAHWASVLSSISPAMTARLAGASPSATSRSLL